MPSPAISPAQTTQIIEQLQAIADLKLVYLFGSRSQHQATQHSDWDIAFLASTRLTNTERWELAQQLAITLGSDVDLVDLSQASTVLQLQVVTQGQLLLGSQYDDDAFAVQVYSMYGDLQESRQAIVQAFLEEVKDE
ncbi:toxin-antitoxin system antidote Mnt family protein [Bacterioplanes sanyensis]|uniref:type VII toxin-antitoxin system MntA family adenylyltransferase antitoxin n=1 Tax=Bacterioplanes sanyensis TaxID=1249553 RepID=UPI00167B136D|nr:nucleotidyltransferase domain-containing protein [Bacterioplanes sanyensis]GGY55733.1 toxin-antitoxin system antidote Mnt family protein [Bacterioplanes sanyensis]